MNTSVVDIQYKVFDLLFNIKSDVINLIYNTSYWKTYKPD